MYFLSKQRCKSNKAGERIVAIFYVKEGETTKYYIFKALGNTILIPKNWQQQETKDVRSFLIRSRKLSVALNTSLKFFIISFKFTVDVECAAIIASVDRSKVFRVLSEFTFKDPGVNYMQEKIAKDKLQKRYNIA